MSGKGRESGITQNLGRFDEPHRTAVATQAVPLEEERRLLRLMESHHDHDGDETKGSVFLTSCKEYIAAREAASRSVRSGGPNF
jgi:hypothetical protein